VTIRSWRLLLFALVLVNLAGAPVSWIVEGVTPSWIAYPALLLVGLALYARGRHAGAVVFVGASALLFLLVHSPFDAEALADHCKNPVNSAKACHPALWLTWLGAIPLVTVVVAGLTWRATERPGPPPPA